jgi:hypothetical protein
VTFRAAGNGDTMRQTTLFSSPSQYERLFAAIETDYLALVVRGRDSSISSGTNNDADVSSLRELKRSTSKSERFGFYMVKTLVDVFTYICLSFAPLQADMFYFGLCIGLIAPLAS